METISTKSIKLFSGLSLAMLLAHAEPASAQSFQTIDLTPYGNFSLGASGATTGFPAGAPTYLGHVPFMQDGGNNEVWNGYYAGGGDGSVLTVPLNISDAYGFYSLINTWWGQDAGNGSFASISFNFSDSSLLTFNLLGNQDIRDFNNPGSSWTTTINGTTSQNVYQNSDGNYVIDRQWFDFGVDDGKTLTSFTLTDNGGGAFQDVLLSGATVQTGAAGQVSGPALLPGETWIPDSVPEPSTWAMMAIGLLFAGQKFYSRRGRNQSAA
jgi:hypothetical protein